MIKNKKYLLLGCSAVLLYLLKQRGMQEMKNLKESLKEDKTIKAAITTVYREPVDPERLHKDEFMNRVKAMTMDELEMIVNYVPVELCMNRIAKELGNAKQLKSSILGLSKEL